MLHRLILVLIFVVAGLSMPLGQSAEADICSSKALAQEQCQSAADLLRKLLKQPDGLKPEKAVEPLPAAITIPALPTPNGQNLPQIIYVPFPTPRPAYNSSVLTPGISILPKAGVAIDPIVTAGIFSKCLDVTKINEPDIKAQRDILKQERYCVTEKKVTENGLDWRIFIIKNNRLKEGPLFVVPHDNENSAFAAGVYGLRKYGGTLVAVEAGEQRLFKGQDPNRNFGTNSATANRCRLQRAPAPKYTRAILKSRKRGQPIIALHSNANGWSGNGGSGNISIQRKGGALPFVSAIARSRLADEDTLIVLASKKPPGKDLKLSKKVKYFTEKAGVNVLYEHVTAAKNDCSLSNYVALKKLGVYFNIEVETGDVKTQKKIVDIVMKSLQ